MPVKPTKTTAVQRLERSKLDPKAVQRELMGKDLDLAKLTIYLKSVIKLDSIDRVTDITVARTIEGASTITVYLSDYDRAILRSGLLNNRLDIQVDGLWWRLVKVKKTGNDLALTFEDRDIAILRTYNKLKLVHRKNATRAEFIVNLLREVKEYRIPYVIPELHVVQPIVKTEDIGTALDLELAKAGGLSADTNTVTANPLPGVEQTLARGVAKRNAGLTVKGREMTKAQIAIANTVIHVGQSMSVRRKVIVTAIMVAIVESTMSNPSGGDLDSVGTFQQRTSWGSLEERSDVATAARLYYLRADKLDKLDPNLPYGDLAQDIQVSAFPDRYNLYRTEAERIVSAYGLPGGDSEGSASSSNQMGQLDLTGPDYIYYRGKPSNAGKAWTKENSWDCIQRLAADVQWRAFFVSGVFYFLSEDDLFKSKPIATITEFSDGVEVLDGDYDIGKKSAALTLQARVGTWLVPPGDVIVLKDMGPMNGRWLVNTYERSLFNSLATITLKKPLPRLPEPSVNDINDLAPGWATVAPDPEAAVYATQGSYTNPLPTKMGDNSEFAVVDAEGAPDRFGVKHHAGKDWFAPGGTIVVAPTDGQIVELRQSSGSSGQIFGGVVKLQQANGYVWVFRHVNPAAPLAEGAYIRQGTPIAAVTTWADAPGSSHAHIEIWRTFEGGYVYENMIDPVLFIEGRAA